jgi:cytochrome c553
MPHRLLLLALCVVAASLGEARASDDTAAQATRGLARSAICASCHGPAGISPIPTYPNIAGQNPLYLGYALRRYKQGERRGEQAGMMYTVTQSLTEQDITDLAAYYAALPPR